MLITPVILSLLIGVLAISFLNPIVASTSKKYADVKSKLIDGQETTISIGTEGLWLRQADETGHTVIRAKRANSDATELYDVTLIREMKKYICKSTKSCKRRRCNLCEYVL